MLGRCVVRGLIVWSAATLGCGGRANDGDAGAGGEPPSAGSGGRGASGSGGAPRGGSAGSVGRAGSAGSAGEFVDPGCPNVPPPAPIVECDPLEPTSRCPAGLACYPFVEHPFGRGCGVATFGAICAQSGSGVQGDPCGEETAGCAPQYMCVIGSSAGRRCAKICVFQGPDECPDGLICGETDVEGYGVCT